MNYVRNDRVSIGKLFFPYKREGKRAGKMHSDHKDADYYCTVDHGLMK